MYHCPRSKELITKFFLERRNKGDKGRFRWKIQRQIGRKAIILELNRMIRDHHSCSSRQHWFQRARYSTICLENTVFWEYRFERGYLEKNSRTTDSTRSFIISSVSVCIYKSACRLLMPMTGKTADPCHSVCYPSGTKSGPETCVVSSQLCWYFRPSFSVVQLSLPPPPVPCVNKYTYTWILCESGWYLVLGPRQINTCRKVPLKVNFLLLFMSLIFLRSKLSFCMNMLVVKHNGGTYRIFLHIPYVNKGYCLCIKAVHVTYS